MVSVAREMAERILRSLEGDPAASGLLPPGGAPCPRSRGFEARNLLFLTVIGIVGAASAGSLFTAAFVLLMERKTAMHPGAQGRGRVDTKSATPLDWRALDAGGRVSKRLGQRFRPSGPRPLSTKLASP
jgi:hypothetical protein